MVPVCWSMAQVFSNFLTVCVTEVPSLEDRKVGDRCGVDLFNLQGDSVKKRITLRNGRHELAYSWPHLVWCHFRHGDSWPRIRPGPMVIRHPELLTFSIHALWPSPGSWLFLGPMSTESRGLSIPTCRAFSWLKHPSIGKDSQIYVHMYIYIYIFFGLVYLFIYLLFICWFIYLCVPLKNHKLVTL